MAKVLAIDGPAGSGKSSLCALVAKRTGWTYLNTGALYRGVGVIARNLGVDLKDETNVAMMIQASMQDIKWRHAERELWFRGQNLTPCLSTQEAGEAASYVAKQTHVRQALLPLQRHLVADAPGGAIVDGRDIGTVVFPDAELKIYLTASLEERAKRRLRQLGLDETIRTLGEIQTEIAKRDEQDSSRGISPLKKADDAIELDTSSIALEEAVELVVNIMQRHDLL